MFLAPATTRFTHVVTRLSALTTSDVAAKPGGLLVPLGATEQHGPHLPLDTDSRIAAAWADAVAQRASGWQVAPVLPYGSSGEHQSFAGTLSIGRDALLTVLVELARSARLSFSSIVFLSGHAGNAEPVNAATKQLVSEGHSARHMFPQWPNEPDIDAHAGRTETAIMLHLAPETVRSTLAASGQMAPISELLPVMRSKGLGAVSANGVLGDPTLATAEEGQRLFDDLVARTVQSLP